jgi:hypothetical protein
MPLDDVDPRRVKQIVEQQERAKREAKDRLEEINGPAWRGIMGIKASYQKAENLSDWRRRTALFLSET